MTRIVDLAEAEEAEAFRLAKVRQKPDDGEGLIIKAVHRSSRTWER